MGPTAEIALWCEGVLRTADAVSVLDLGCGTGGISNHLAGAGFDVFGVDQSSWRISLAKRNSATSKYVQADFFEFSPPRQFDAIVVSRVLHMLSAAQRARLLTICAQWLTPGGTICAIDAQVASRLVLAEEFLIGLVDPNHFANYKEFMSSGALLAATGRMGWFPVSKKIMLHGVIGLALGI